MSNEPENIECSSCGAALRPNASFCHKCGAKFFAVDTETASLKGEEPAVSSAWFKADISAPEALSETEANEALEATEAPEVTADFEKTAGTVEPEFQETLHDAPPPPLPVEEPEDIPAPLVEAGTLEEIESPPIPAIVRSKPARKAGQSLADPALRRKPKLQREKLEMMWEEPESGINAVFVIGSIVIFVLVLLMILAVYFVR